MKADKTTTKQKTMYIKGFDKDLKCRGFQFEVGKEYKIETDRPLELCTDTIFHFCDSLQKVNDFYSCEDSASNRFCEIEVLGGIVQDDEKDGSNHIKIVREIIGAELDALKGRINGNTGLFNTGNRNTGNWNTGNNNTGNCNTGNRNTGNWNTGNNNTGNCNTGYCNTGYWNTGGGNIGDCNTGYCNTGNRNTGDHNTGNCNTGDWNTGNCNSCNNSNGVFCSIEPKINVFNKPSDYTLTEFREQFSDVLCILRNLVLTEIIDGKLVSYSYKEAWEKLWASLTQKEKDKVKTLPNFDADVFSEITGINKGDR